MANFLLGLLKRIGIIVLFIPFLFITFGQLAVGLIIWLITGKGIGDPVLALLFKWVEEE